MRRQVFASLHFPKQPLPHLTFRQAASYYQAYWT